MMESKGLEIASDFAKADMLSKDSFQEKNDTSWQKLFLWDFI